MAPLLDAIAYQTGFTRLGRHLLGRCRGVDVNLELDKKQCRLSASLYPEFDLGLSIAPRNRGRGGEHRVLMQHPGMNMRFIVNADEPARAHALLPHHACTQFLSAFDAHTDVFVTDWGASVAMSAREAPHIVIGHIDRLAWLVSGLNEQRHQIPPSSRLTEQLDAWKHLADQHGLRGMMTPLCLWGDTAGGTIHAFARRTSPFAYRLVVAIHFREPLGFGLSLGPKGLAERLLDVNDVHTGNAAFDAAFLLQTPHPQQASTLLTQQVCAMLLAMRQHTEEVSLDDNGVTVAIPGVMPPPRTTHGLIGQMVTLAEHIEGTRRAAMRAGPYR
jgi:hypothetical protein